MKQKTHMNVNPDRVIRDLNELRALTGDDAGAQRVAWTQVWSRAREWYRAKLAELPVTVETDAAANIWATLPGASPRALLIGSHLDSVPNGGWLDGCFGVIGGLEILRRISAQFNGRPPVTVRLIDWADEEGARFGRSLFGSSAVAGRLNPEWVNRLVDRDGVRLPDAVGAYGVHIDSAEEARAQLAHAAAYLEMHIEQGPVLESLGLPLGAVIGCFGIERHALTFTGQAAHAGATPMPLRHDAFVAAARFAVEVREIGRASAGGVCTTGRVQNTPGVPTAVAGETLITLDQRHIDTGALAQMNDAAREASVRIAREEGVSVHWSTIYQSPVQPFDTRLIDACDAAIREVNAGISHRLPSGPGHDAIEMAWSGVPTAMLFVQSLQGLSHCKEEDTRLDHLALAVRAFDRLAGRVVELIATGLLPGRRPA
jgi:beta-ureidopropionase / N-carbamoyl-L-amino-acid hydrolase